MNRLICAVAVLAVSTAQADTIYVDVDCPGPGSGTEGDPYCSIQTAIDGAGHLDEIIVAPGVYFEIIDLLGKTITLVSSGEPEVTIIDGQGMGTVVWCFGGAPVVEGLTITHGCAPDGAGMFIGGASPIVRNCRFVDNVAEVGGFGGAMLVLGMAASPTIIGCTFVGNHASAGGGVQVGSSSHAAFTECLFERNSAIGGGGFFTSFNASATIDRCGFFGNEALTGGAIANGNAEMIVSNCLFVGNIASLRGGAFSQNATEGKSSHLVNCTIAFNTAEVSGGGIRNHEQGSSAVDNCIVWGNTDPGGTGGTGQIDGPVGMTVSFSDVQNGWGGPGDGNIDAEPAFVDADSDDYRLSPDSPCIDAGDNTAVPVDITTDLDGNPCPSRKLRTSHCT